MLTEKQKKILNIIENYIENKKMSPTVRAISEITGLVSTSTVQGYIDRLEKAGFISKEKGCSRSIRIK